MPKYKFDGDTIDYTPVADVVAGQLVKVGNRCGLANVDIPANKLGALRVCGVIETEMATVGSAINVGDELDFNFTTQKVVAAGTGDANVQVFAAAPASTGSNVKLLVYMNRFGG